MTLRDYFHEKWSTQGAGNEKHSAQLVPITDVHRGDDDWALAHLNVIKLQPISEAFDDDASGFITVTEANTFTTSRPLGWRCVVILNIIENDLRAIVYHTGSHIGQWVNSMGFFHAFSIFDHCYTLRLAAGSH
jgi:hypothetical protein